VKVLFIHGCQLPVSSCSHQATETVPSALPTDEGPAEADDQLT
jgi:hypothetical protein